MVDWKSLETELAIWCNAGLELPFWWRDDDAIETSPQLDQLLDLSQETGLPVHLAVIPNGTEQALADHLVNNPQAVPVVHGFSHLNHAAKGEKKCEFGEARAHESVQADIENGLKKLQQQFGSNLAPLFVPPWNRFATQYLPILADAGYRAVSTFTPRQSTYAIGGLEQINAHIDPINWHGNRSVHSADLLIAQTVELLQYRRNGSQDNTEPLGYLTHHLVHDLEIWDFTAKFIETMLAGPVTLWNARTLKGQKT